MLGFPETVPLSSQRMHEVETWIDEVNVFQVLDMHLFVDRCNAEQGIFYVALEISQVCPVGCPHLSLTFPSAHITVGTYINKVDPACKKRNTLKKAAAAFEKRIEQCGALEAQWRRQTPKIRIGKSESVWESRGSSTTTGPPPLVFSLRLCDEAFAVDRLVDRVQKMLSGVAAVHYRGSEGTQRTMGHLRGPDFHLSLWSDLLLTWRPPAGLVDTPPPQWWRDFEDETGEHYIFEV